MIREKGDRVGLAEAKKHPRRVLHRAGRCRRMPRAHHAGRQFG